MVGVMQGVLFKVRKGRQWQVGMTKVLSKNASVAVKNCDQGFERS